MKKVVAILVCLATLLMLMPVANVSAYKYDMKSPIPTLVFVIGFDADGDGKEASTLGKNTKDKNSSAYGEQWSHTTADYWYDELFGDNGNTMMNYFKHMSNDQFYFTPAPETEGTVNDGIIHMTLNLKHPYAVTNSTTGRSSEMTAALDYADKYVDFSQFDKNKDGTISWNELALVYIIGGYSTKLGWGGNGSSISWGVGNYQTSGNSVLNYKDGVRVYSSSQRVCVVGEYQRANEPLTFGSIAHELAHLIGAKDLYTYGGYTWAGGPGDIALQGGGSSLGPNKGVNYGRAPAAPDPFHTTYLWNWFTPTVAHNGEYTLYSRDTGNYNIIKIETRTPGEYYLIENRYTTTRETFDAIPAASRGIQVWHCDERIFDAYQLPTCYIAGQEHPCGLTPLYPNGATGGSTYQTWSSATGKNFVANSFKFPVAGTFYTSMTANEAKDYNFTIEFLSAPGNEMKIRISGLAGCVSVENGETVYRLEHTFLDAVSENDFSHSKTCTVCKSKEIDPHTFDSGVVIKESTCKEKGIKKYTCLVCNYSKEVEMELVDHTFGEYVKIDDTNHKRTCSVCLLEETTEHKFGRGVVTKEPNCKDTGIKVHTCTSCPATKEEEVPKTTVHSWDSGYVTLQPTCKDTGLMMYSCLICNEVRYEDIKKTNVHTYGELTKIDELYHSRTCAICGNEEKTAHSYNNGIVTLESTCKDTGIKTYTCKDCGATKTSVLEKTTSHVYTNSVYIDENKHSSICTVCGEEATLNHTWDEGTILKAPTTTEEGKMFYVCTYCLANKTTTIEKLDHEHVLTHVPGKEATCISEGQIDYYLCSVCNKMFKEAECVNEVNNETIVIGKNTIHGKIVLKGYVKETSNTPGYTGDEVCELCGEVLKYGTIIPVHTHIYDGEKFVENENGHSRVCDICGEKEDSILEHHFCITWIKEPTASEEGIELTTCMYGCGYHLEKAINKLPPEMINTTEVVVIGKDETVSFRSSASIDDFVEVLLDGNVVDRSNYDVRSGSIIIEFHKDFLESLEEGEHTVSIVSTTGEAVASFKVESTENEPGEKEIINDALDSSSIIKYLCFGAVVIALICVVIVIIVKVKKKRG